MLLSLVAASAAMSPPRRIHVVVNPFGGGGVGLSTLDAILPVFEKAGIEVTTLKTEYAGHAGILAQTEPLLDAFVGIGGDGTAHEIANGMLRRDEAERVPVGVIPAGSGNTWAFDLGLDDAITAAELIVSGDTQQVDVMQVGPADDNGAEMEFAINICGYGMPAAVLEQANALRWLGTAQYELAGLLLIASGQTSYSATLEIEAADGAVTTRELDDVSFVQVTDAPLVTLISPPIPRCSPRPPHTPRSAHHPPTRRLTGADQRPHGQARAVRAGRANG